MPCIIIIEGVLPSDLVSMEQFFIDRLAEEMEDPIEEQMRQAVLVRSPPADAAPPPADAAAAPPAEPGATLPLEMSYRRLPIGGCQIIALPPPTPFKCWFCDLGFATPPWFIPTDMREERNNVVVLIASGVSGNFCSDVCACGWLPQFLEGALDRYTMLLRNEIQARTGRLEFRLPVPVPKTERREYGGALSVDEYRKEIQLRTLG